MGHSIIAVSTTTDLMVNATMLRRTSSSTEDVGAVPYDQCYAKTWQTDQGEICLGRKVLEHCIIVGTIAEKLIEHYPATLGNILFPEGSPLAAAAHDIGKVSPAFLIKLFRAARQKLPFTTTVSPELEKRWGGHAGVSQVAAEGLGLPAFVPEILGQHHGFTPPVSGTRAEDDIFGGPTWQQERKHLADELCQRLGMSWPTIESDAQARLIAGLTSVADWIGSGSWFEDPNQPWQPNIEKALDDAGWHTPAYKPGQSFSDVFGFTARAAQQQLIDAVQGPGVYTLEAPMGLGKTEAALYAAYQALAAGRASGIYFALPTQLTSNKIYERFNQFLSAILTTETPIHSRLLHSGAWLVETAMGKEGEPGHSWFAPAKRGLLAPFAVGTLDQALMAAMNVRHGFVRAFGLAGKVVILDEVHTYDAYTSTLLDALIALLRQLHCTVIILTATLNQSRRTQLLQAPLQSTAYPLISALPNHGKVQELAVATETDDAVFAITLQQKTEPAIEEALRRAEQGQQVLWIENTVAEAQQVYLLLAARAKEINVGCGLLHSRFTPEDRNRNEATWVTLFGKDGWPKRSQQGRILVGTQVLEQSLDIDADFLVSRFAPTDMLLQRVGRLWRHSETPRHPSALRESWLLAPELNSAIAAPYAAFGHSASVYAPYVLCRSLEVWHDRKTVSLPVDIRPLIDATYDDQDDSDAMMRWRNELEYGNSRRKGRQALTQLARIGLASGGKTLSDNQTQTRYSELDSVEVLLLRSIEPLAEGGCQLTLLNGDRHTIPGSRHLLNKRQWRELSATLMRQVVTINPQNAPSPTATDSLRKLGLGHCFYLGRPEYDEAVIRLALVNEDDTLQGLFGATAHQEQILEYCQGLGYRSLKQEGM